MRHRARGERDRQTQDMKSCLPETGPLSPETETVGHQKSQPDKSPKEDQEKKENGDIEKDSGYSDSSSESISSEEPAGSSKVNEPQTSPETTPTQEANTPTYIIQNVVVNQPGLLLLQQPVRRPRKRPNPSAYLPILRSYPRIAPRLTTPPASTSQASPPPVRSPSPTVRSPTPPKKEHAPSQLLDISLRSVALLHRTRETQRSLRELRIHTKLYHRALRGEEGGWDRLRKAMERSGVYPEGTSPSGNAESSLAEEPFGEGNSPSRKAVWPLEEAIDSSAIDMSLEEVTIKGESIMDVV